MDYRIFKEMLENFYEGVYFVDQERKITFWNKGAERITGFSANEVIDSYCFNNILNHVDDDGNQLCKGGCPLHKTLVDGEERENGVYLHHKDGHRVSVNVRTIPIYDNGQIIGAVEVFNDNTINSDLFKEIEDLKILASMDQLTDLPNRRYVDAFIKSKHAEFSALEIPYGVMFMDIDHFKSVNDDYGHDAGDKVLQMVAKTFRSTIRSNDIVGRWGGEEFVAVFQGVTQETLNTLAEKMRMLVERSSIRENEFILKVTVSIGATLVNPEDSIETILARADKLMYEAKDKGRNQVSVG